MSKTCLDCTYYQSGYCLRVSSLEDCGPAKKILSPVSQSCSYFRFSSDLLDDSYLFDERYYWDLDEHDDPDYYQYLVYSDDFLIDDDDFPF